MKRKVLSVVVGLVAAIVSFLIAESINGMIHPVPPTLDFKDAAAIKLHYQNQPISFWLMVLAGWLTGSLLCGYLIRLISKSNNKTLPLMAGGILTLSAIANFFAFPHPAWFVVVGLMVFVPATLLGHGTYNKIGLK